MGLALGRRRKDMFLSTKVFANTIADAEKSLAKSITLLMWEQWERALRTGPREGHGLTINAGKGSGGSKFKSAGV